MFNEMAYRNWLSVLLTSLVLLGCADGAQRGRFVVTGSSTLALEGYTGDLTIVQGDSMPLTAQSTGQQPLLYILALAPGVDASGGGISGGSGGFLSNWKWLWQTPRGDVTMEISWNRKTDQVTASGSTFDRQRGNAFVLVRDASGKVSVTQLGPLNAGLDMSAALRQVQSALPANSAASGVKIR